MIKKILELKCDIDNEKAEEISLICFGFGGMVMLETGKKTVKCTDVSSLSGCGAKKGERVRVIIDGGSEEQTFEAISGVLS